MHNLVTHIIFGTLTLIVLIGFFIRIKNEIKMRKFSAMIKKKLKKNKASKLAYLDSEVHKKIIA